MRRRNNRTVEDNTFLEDGNKWMRGTDLAEQRKWKASAYKEEANENKAMWTAELQEFSGITKSQM